MKKNMYVTLDFDYLNKADVERKLICQVKENEDEVNLTFSTLCDYFEPELLEGARKQWPEKRINIKYSNSVYLGYYNFRAFKKVVFDGDSPENYK